MNKKSYSFGFTMAEMLVCLSVISIIATILIPSIGNLRPNKTKAMFKKAYQVTERVVYELVNDIELYPEGSGVVGFDNVGFGEFVADPDKTDDENAAEQLKQVKTAKSKFCQLFAQKVNTTDTLNCVAGANTSAVDGSLIPKSKVSFSTSDGIIWTMPFTNFTNGSSNSPAWKYILVDVNGDLKPNKLDSEQDTAKCETDVDRFKIYVRADGLMTVRGACAREYLNSMSIVKNNKDTHLSNSDMAGSGDDLIDGSAEDSADGSNHDANAESNDDDKFTDQQGTGDYNP